MNIKRSALSLFGRLVKDTRGEDYTEKSSQLSNTAKVIITALAITAAGGGAAAVANNTNKQTETTQDRLLQSGGAGAGEKADKVSSPFLAK